MVRKEGATPASEYRIEKNAIIYGRTWLRNPCLLGVPNRRGQNQKWLHHPCLLGGPKMGGLAT